MLQYALFLSGMCSVSHTLSASQSLCFPQTQAQLHECVGELLSRLQECRAQPVQAGSVTQCLWNGERLSGGRVPAHGRALAGAAVWAHHAGSTVMVWTHRTAGFGGSP